MNNETYEIDYNKGKIYKIICNITGLIYVGSTTKEYLTQRLSQHKRDYRKYLNGKRCYMTSYQILENGNYNIVLLESDNYNSKNELHSRERFYIENLDCVNKCIPCQTSKEYRIKNREKINIYKNTKFECECGGSYSRKHRAEHFKTKKHSDYLLCRYDAFLDI